MNADGSDERQLTSASGRDSNPAWSPDGTKIAWTRASRLWIMNADGSGQAEVPLQGTLASAPDWQPLTGPRREDYKNASHFCKALRDFMGDEAFAREYRNHGGCVSRSH
jgi:WD40 repeat protein